MRVRQPAPRVLGWSASPYLVFRHPFDKREHVPNVPLVGPGQRAQRAPSFRRRPFHREHLAEQVVRERVDGGIIEDGCRREVALDQILHVILQLERQQRVHAELEEPLVWLRRVPRQQPHDEAHLTPEGVDKDFVPLLGRRLLERAQEVFLVATLGAHKLRCPRCGQAAPRRSVSAAPSRSS